MEVRIDVAAAGSHDEAFQRGEAHRGVHAEAALHGAGAAAVAEVGGDQLVSAGIFAQQPRGLGRHEAVAGAVEPVTADLVFFVKLVRNGIEKRLLRHRLVERRVKHRDVRQRGKTLRAASMPTRLAGLCSGASGTHSRIAARVSVIDLRAVRKRLAAMDDAVADGADARLVEPVQHGRHRHRVVCPGNRRDFLGRMIRPGNMQRRVVVRQVPRRARAPGPPRWRRRSARISATSCHC